MKPIYSRKITLSAVEISHLSILLRESVASAKQQLQTAPSENVAAIEEFIAEATQLQQKFQRLAKSIETQVLADIAVITKQK